MRRGRFRIRAMQDGYLVRVRFINDPDKANAKYEALCMELHNCQIYLDEASHPPVPGTFTHYKTIRSTQ